MTKQLASRLLLQAVRSCLKHENHTTRSDTTVKHKIVRKSFKGGSSCARIVLIGVAACALRMSSSANSAKRLLM